MMILMIMNIMIMMWIRILWHKCLAKVLLMKLNQQNFCLTERKITKSFKEQSSIFITDIMIMMSILGIQMITIIIFVDIFDDLEFADCANDVTPAMQAKQLPITDS